MQRREGGMQAVIAHAMGRMRLSLTFRIAIHYCMQLIRTIFGSAVILTICAVVAAWMILSGPAEMLRQTAPDGEDGSYTQLVLQDSRLHAQWRPVAADDRDPDGTAAWVRANMRSLPREGKLIMLLPSAQEDGLVTAVYDMDLIFHIWLLMLGGLAACDLLRMLYFIRHHHGLNKRVLAPIHDITELAATLSANNLSNRINIAGTKNELKDLAGVINTMLDRIERSYNSQKQFVSDASHELRTPIAVIQGYVSMLQRWGKDDKTVMDESLEAIAQETASMKDLVENLLFLARHDKKTLMLEMEQFDPCDIVQELHREAEMVTPEDHFELMACEHTEIEADRNMIKQVMRILLDNAVKYTPKGGVISMGVYATPTGCTLVMKDNGPGIPGDELPKIFDRFYRSDKARKAESGGHGLGLSIARIIVIAHGGKIRVRSKEGEGAVFSVMLPQRQAKPQE